MVGSARAESKRRQERTRSREWKPARRLFTADEYHRMAEAGILRRDEHVELIEGEILQVAPLGSRHAGRVDWLNAWFSVRLAGRVIVRIQSSVRLALRLEPEPDVALLRFRDDFYASRLPGPDDVLLIIEVADTSLPYDRDTKQRLYATAGIREFWIVDLRNMQLLVCRSPRDGRYTENTALQPGATISPLEFPELSLTVDEILG